VNAVRPHGNARRLFADGLEHDRLSISQDQEDHPGDFARRNVALDPIGDGLEPCGIEALLCGFSDRR
jgi:hypothetical protein